MSQSIRISPSMNEYFYEVVSDALRVRQVEATTEASTYLVGLLCEYAHPDEQAESTFSQPLTFLLRDAIDSNGTDRFRKLQKLGDGVLYVLGFFGSHVETSGVDKGYVVSVGSTAYQHAAAMLRLKGPQQPEPNVLSELSAKFERFAAVLRDVSDGTLACGPKDERTTVKLYERWLKTGSSRLAEELSTRGIIPTKGSSGMN